jgi:hypothetical protein
MKPFHTTTVGGGAQIQDDLAGPGLQTGYGRHGAGLLEIVYARLVPDMQTGPGIGGVVIAMLRPGHRLLQEGEGGVLIGFEGVEAQGNRPWAVQRAQIIVIFIAQLLFQAGKKGFGEHKLPPVCGNDFIIENPCGLVKVAEIW